MATLATHVADADVRRVWLAKVDFGSGSQRYWIGGFGERTWGGNTWKGLGELVAITDVESSIGDVSTGITFSFSGAAAAVLTRAQGAKSEWYGKTVTLYDGYFLASDLQTMDLGPRVIWIGTLDTMMVAADFNAEDGHDVVVNFEAIDRRGDRSKPRFSMLTKEDQQARYADDTGMNLIPYNKKVMFS